ncbi:MAG: DNA gyrase inhibitor YacG [Acidobacteriota bacterium]|nr:DNA gyrase inhibitor YacG [Acidobacteriota bacterium]
MKIKCANCGKQTEWEGNEFRPFCSERCRMIDFGAWIDEEYRVPDENSAITNNASFDLPDEENTDFKNVNL